MKKCKKCTALSTETVKLPSIVTESHYEKRELTFTYCTECKHVHTSKLSSERSELEQFDSTKVYQVGSKFKFDNKCIEVCISEDCTLCVFRNSDGCCTIPANFNECLASFRPDSMSINFQVI